MHYFKGCQQLIRLNRTDFGEELLEDFILLFLPLIFSQIKVISTHLQKMVGAFHHHRLRSLANL
jgi:hypothetical protein